MLLMNLKNLFPLVLTFFLVSCSLEYYKAQNSEDSTPEFIFNDASFSRYENGKSKIKLQAEKIEQYKSDSSTYAKNAQFDSYDDDGKLETTGNCGLLEAQTETEKYKLFKNIYLNMISQEMEVRAESLFFDRKSEQITSDYDSQVQLSKDGLNVFGTGFSGSGVSKSYVFEYGVNGTIETDDGNEAIEKSETDSIRMNTNEKDAHGLETENE